MASAGNNVLKATHFKVWNSIIDLLFPAWFSHALLCRKGANLIKQFRSKTLKTGTQARPDKPVQREIVIVNVSPLEDWMPKQLVREGNLTSGERSINSRYTGTHPCSSR